MESNCGNSKKNPEQLKKNKFLIDKTSFAKSEVLALFNEIEKCEKEIEYQTEQLIKAKKEAKNATKKYNELYDFAPTGYFTLSVDGLITETNRRGAQMLGNSKKQVVNTSFANYVLPETKPYFEKFLDCVFSSSKKRTCEITVLTKNNTFTYLYISARNATNNEQCFVTAVDLSEWKKAEQELAKSEERYRIFFENNDAIILFIDPQSGKIIFANDSAAAYYGYTKLQLENMNIRKINTLSPQQIKEKTKEALKKKQNYFVFKHKLASGEIRDVEIYQTKIKLNKKLLFSIIVHDITERKQAENLMAESQERFNLAMKATKDGIFDKNLITGEIYYSPGWKNMLGYRDDELPNESWVWKKLASLADVKRSKKMMNDLIHKKIERYKLEFRLKHKNGQWVDVLSRAEAVFDKNGMAVRIVGTHVDITERKKAEKIQQVIFNISNAVGSAESLEKFCRHIQHELGKIIDTTNFYVALYNNITNSLTLPFFADEKDNFSSIPAGKTLTNYVIKTKQTLLATPEKLEELNKKGEVESYGSSQKIWLGVPLRVEGKVTGVLAVQSYKNQFAYTMSDSKMLGFIADQISILIDRKKAEEVLKETLKKATESDRLKSAFLATISHELRTPLNAIIGFSDFLSKNSSPDEVEKFSQIIKNSGYHLLSIVNDLFDLTLIQSGEIKINNEEITVNSILLQIHNLITDKQRRSNKSHIKIELLLDTGFDVLLNTDANKLKQILLNLLKNALKFTEKGAIKYGYNVRKSGEAEDLVFYVEDSGIGIEKSKQSLIFDIFRQVEDHSTRRFGGTGIGLSVAKKLTQLLGGKIWVESEINKGSTFFFTIPVKKAAKKEEDKTYKIIDRTGYSNKTVLIVEDDKLSFEFVNYAIVGLGLNCLWAKNGKEAIKIYRATPEIELVLMDINMPVMDGFEATKKLKKLNADLPVIAQTAHAIAGDREKILESGCDEYLSKPIDKNLLTEIIDRYLGE